MSFINEFFSAVTAGIEGSKKEVRGKRLRSSPGGGSSGGDRKEDLTTNQITEVSELIQGGMNGLAQVVGAKLQQQNDRLAALEQNTEEHSTKQNELEQRVAAIEQRPPASSASVEDLQTQLTQLQASINAPATPAPPELQNHAVIGNLGWDADEQTIEQRAVELLNSVGITPDQYENLSAMRQKGSMAELWFKDPLSLIRARLQVRAKKQVYPDNSKPAWLDVKKSKEQLKPARMVHRIADFLEDVEKAKTTPGTITKDVVRKVIKRNDDIMGSIYFGKWRWSVAGIFLYDEAVRENAVECAAVP